MDPLAVLNDIRIATPCPASWDEMEGGDRARFCLACQTRVYDLSTLTAAEAVSLIERNEGSLCVRLYRRADGTVLTADCPVGLRARAAAKLRRVGAGATALAAFLLTGAFLKARPEPTAFSTSGSVSHGGAPATSLSEWFMGIFRLRTPAPPTTGVMVLTGKVCLPPPPTRPAPAAFNPEEVELPDDPFASR